MLLGLIQIWYFHIFSASCAEEVFRHAKWNTRLIKLWWDECFIISQPKKVNCFPNVILYVQVVQMKFLYLVIHLFTCLLFSCCHCLSRWKITAIIINEHYWLGDSGKVSPGCCRNMFQTGITLLGSTGSTIILYGATPACLLFFCLIGWFFDISKYSKE